MVFDFAAKFFAAVLLSAENSGFLLRGSCRDSD